MRNPAKILMMLGLSGVLATTMGSVMVGCGDDAGMDGGVGGTGGTGGGSSETKQEGGGGDTGTSEGGEAGSASYKYLVIYDKEKIDCTLTTGPGSDIDAVELMSGGSKVGVGMKGSGLFGPGTGACTKCGSSGGACGHTGKSEEATVEGVRDAVIYKSKTDTGYISLNSGSIQLQIGDVSGAGPAKEFKKGDTVIVHEVDQLYKGVMATDPDMVCKCEPEKYELFAFKAMADGKIDPAGVRAKPGAIDSKNKMACDAMPMGPMDDPGCGTTTFTLQ